MTLRFALSKVLQILLRLWGVDTAAAPPATRDGSAEAFARARVRRIYARDGIRVAVSPRRVRNRE